MYIFLLKQRKSPETREWKYCYKNVRKITDTKSSLVYRRQHPGKIRQLGVLKRVYVGRNPTKLDPNRFSAVATPEKSSSIIQSMIIFKRAFLKVEISYCTIENRGSSIAL